MSIARIQISDSYLKKIVYDAYGEASAKTYFRHFDRIYARMYPEYNGFFNIHFPETETTMMQFIKSDEWRQVKEKKRGMPYSRKSIESHKYAIRHVISALNNQIEYNNRYDAKVIVNNSVAPTPVPALPTEMHIYHHLSPQLEDAIMMLVHNSREDSDSDSDYEPSETSNTSETDSDSDYEPSNASETDSDSDSDYEPSETEDEIEFVENKKNYCGKICELMLFGAAATIMYGIWFAPHHQYIDINNII